ncbi:hypothetical protein KIPB_002474, partial [Kipferlia bialata]|eukprot:g2474.t1
METEVEIYATTYGDTTEFTIAANSAGVYGCAMTEVEVYLELKDANGLIDGFDGRALSIYMTDVGVTSAVPVYWSEDQASYMASLSYSDCYTGGDLSVSLVTETMSTLTSTIDVEGLSTTLSSPSSLYVGVETALTITVSDADGATLSAETLEVSVDGEVPVCTGHQRTQYRVTRSCLGQMQRAQGVKGVAGKRVQREREREREREKGREKGRERGTGSRGKMPPSDLGLGGAKGTDTKRRPSVETHIELDQVKIHTLTQMAQRSDPDVYIRLFTSKSPVPRPDLKGLYEKAEGDVELLIDACRAEYIDVQRPGVLTSEPNLDAIQQRQTEAMEALTRYGKTGAFIGEACKKASDPNGTGTSMQKSRKQHVDHTVKALHQVVKKGLEGLREIDGCIALLKEQNNLVDTYLRTQSRLEDRVTDLDAATDPECIEGVEEILRLHASDVQPSLSRLQQIWTTLGDESNKMSRSIKHDQDEFLGGLESRKADASGRIEAARIAQQHRDEMQRHKRDLEATTETLLQGIDGASDLSERLVLINEALANTAGGAICTTMQRIKETAQLMGDTDSDPSSEARDVLESFTTTLDDRKRETETERELEAERQAKREREAAAEREAEAERARVQREVAQTFDWISEALGFDKSVAEDEGQYPPDSDRTSSVSTLREALANNERLHQVGSGLQAGADQIREWLQMDVRGVYASECHSGLEAGVTLPIILGLYEDICGDLRARHDSLETALRVAKEGLVEAEGLVDRCEAGVAFMDKWHKSNILSVSDTIDDPAVVDVMRPRYQHGQVHWKGCQKEAVDAHAAVDRTQDDGLCTRLQLALEKSTLHLNECTAALGQIDDGSHPGFQVRTPTVPTGLHGQIRPPPTVLIRPTTMRTVPPQVSVHSCVSPVVTTGTGTDKATDSDSDRQSRQVCRESPRPQHPAGHTANATVMRKQIEESKDTPLDFGSQAEDLTPQGCSCSDQPEAETLPTERERESKAGDAPEQALLPERSVATQAEVGSVAPGLSKVSGLQVSPSLPRDSIAIHDMPVKGTLPLTNPPAP